MSLLGIEGTTISSHNEFIDIFNKLINNPSISIIFISMDLPENIINYLLNFKLNHIRPFIFLLPRLFQKEIDEKSIFLKKIYKTIGKLLI